MNAARIFPLTPSGPNESGLVHSNASMTPKPTSSSATVPTTVRRVWVDQVRGCLRRASSNSTGKPMPPAMTPTVRGTQIHQSVTNPLRLSLKSAKPALLNADTPWNTPYHSDVPSDLSYPKKKRPATMNAMTASATSMVSATRMSTWRTLANPRLRPSAWASSRVRMPRRWDTIRASMVAAVTIPKPPSWTSSMIMVWPNPDQYVAVSTTVIPVTQTADVDVNSAVMNGACPCPARDAGSQSSRVPTAMAPRNAIGTSRAGCCTARRIVTQ